MAFTKVTVIFLFLMAMISLCQVSIANDSFAKNFVTSANSLEGAFKNKHPHTKQAVQDSKQCFIADDVQYSWSDDHEIKVITKSTNPSSSGASHDDGVQLYSTSDGSGLSPRHVSMAINIAVLGTMGYFLYCYPYAFPFTVFVGGLGFIAFAVWKSSR